MNGKFLPRRFVGTALSLLVVWLTLAAMPALAICEAVPGQVLAGTTAPIVYQDCVENIDLDFDSPSDSMQLLTSPGTQTGDVLVMAVVMNRAPHTISVTTTSPAGWSALTLPSSMANVSNGQNGSNDVTLGVYIKTATANGSETVTLSATNTNNNEQVVAWVMRFSNTLGQDTTAGSYALSRPGRDDDAVSPSITTSTANSMVLRLAGVDDDDTSAALDSNILGTSSNGFANTAISMQESSGGGNSVTAIAAYHLKSVAGAIGTSTTTSSIGGNEEYVAYTMALLPRRYFTLAHAASAQSCNLNSITIEARNINGSINTTYTGTVTLSTSTTHGYWTKTGGDANGSLTTSGNGDGTATYTFALSDAGTIELVYYNPIIETVNFNLVDGSGNRELKTLSNDSNLTLTSCGAITKTNQTCSAAGVYDNNGGNIGTGIGGNPLFPYAIPSGTTGNRMVVVVYSGEDTSGTNRSAATATFNGVAMQSIAFQRTDDVADNYTQIFAINHAALPAAANIYNIRLTNVADDAALCAFTLTGVSQTYPTGNGTGLPANVSGNIGNNTISTAITTTAANSYVIAGVGNGGSGSYNPRTGALAELHDIEIGGGGAVFSVAGGVVAAAGSFTASSVATNANRQAQAVVAFAPTGGGYIKISHAGAGPTCGATPITITIANGAGNPDPTFTGTITLTTSNNLGSWSIPAGSPGTFTNLGNGSATYTFVSADGGDAVLNFTPANTATVNFNVTAAAMPSLLVSPLYDPDLSFEACQLRILPVFASGNTCTANAIGFSLVTVSGAPVAGYTGTISVATATAESDKGTWTLAGGGNGLLVDTTARDGAATYTFAASDNGAVTLYFASTRAGVYNFDVGATGISLNGAYDPNYTLTNCKFIVSYNTGLPADVCTPQEVTIRAADPAGNTISNFDRQVIIGTSTGHGNWRPGGSQAGTFFDPSADDGAALYTFVPADAGQVTLLLSAPVAETLKLTVETLDGAMEVDTNALNNPDLSLALCSFRFTLADGQLPLCGEELVTLAVFNSNNTLATSYTGTVNLATASGNGTWRINQANNAIADPVPGDGAATYIFSALDNGAVSLFFSSDTVESLNMNAVDTQEAGFRESLSHDPVLSVLTCFPTIVESQCYRGQSQEDAISVSAASSLESRMVLLYAYVESSDNPPTTATLNDGVSAYPMTLIRSVQANEVWMGVWGINGANLPAQASSFDVAYNGGAFNLPGYGARAPGMCLVSLEGVEQPNLATLGSSAQVNGIAMQATGSQITTNTLTVDTQENSSLVIGVAGNGHGSANTSSTLGVSHWNLTDTDSDGPESAQWHGDSDVIPTPQTVSVTVTNGGSPSFYRFAHIVMSLSPIVPGQPYGTSYVPVNLFDTLAGNLGYRAVGASLRSQSNYGNSCAMNSSASAVLPLPAGSSIEAAYLYWSGSGGTADIDDQVSFGPTGSLVSLAADNIFQVKSTISAITTEYFLGYKDITPLIRENQTAQQYTLQDLSVQTGGNWAQVSTCMGGWGMVVVFDNNVVEPDVNVINLFHGFQPFQNSGFTLVPRNFRMAEPNVLTNVPRGTITHITFEGDDTLNNGTEVFELQNDPNNLTFDILNNPSNQGNAQYNDTVSYPDYSQIGTYNPATASIGYITQSSTSYGTDVDTYYLGGTIAVAADSKEDMLYPFGLAQSEQITTRYSAGQDLVLLAGEFIAVTNADLADLEMFTSTAGDFRVNSVGTGSFLYDVVNNGNNASSNGYATGTVILSGRMPIGITIHSIPAAEHWNCTVAATFNAFTCVFDIQSWSGGTVNTANPLIRQLDDTAYAAAHSTLAALPTVEVKVSVGNETAFANITNPSSFSGRIAHYASPLDCAMPAVGYQPDPLSCTRAEEFDNVDDLNKHTIDIDDLTEKSNSNNNVDRADYTIAGLQTDLAMNVSLAGVLQAGESASYQLQISNNGPDAASKAMTVTATFPPGLVPQVPSPLGWTCAVASQTLTCISDPNLLVLNSGASSVIHVTTGPLGGSAGDFVSTTATVLAGAYNFDTVSGNNSDTEISEIVGEITPINDRFLLSVNENSTLGGAAFGSQDLLLYDPVTDEGEVFLAMASLTGASAADVDAVHLLPNGWVVFSTKDSGTLGGVSFDDEDLVLYDPVLDVTTLLFDGSEANKFSTQAGAADIDAVFVEINNSYEPQDWTLFVSVETGTVLNSVAVDDNDIASYAMTGAGVNIVFNGSDANKFGGSAGAVAGLYIRNDDDTRYVLSTSTIGSPVILESESYTSDDLVSYDIDAAPGAHAARIFDGALVPGQFTPVSATRGIDAIHVVEDRYYGHFAITTTDGSTCSMGMVTLRKHAGLTHEADTIYTGSVRLQASSATASWYPDASNNGVLQNLGGGLAIYTFDPADQGVAVLAVAQSSQVLNIDIDVTNGIAQENSLEDMTLDISASHVQVTFQDNFSAVSYSGSSGNASWSGNWAETGDDNVVSSGDLRISGGKLRLRDTDGDKPALARSVTFDFTPNTDVEPLKLGFLWSRTGGSASDTFQAQYNLNGGGWITIGSWGGAANGAIPENAVVVNLTGAGVTVAENDTLMIRFRANSGLMLDSIWIDNVKLSTSTDTSCSPGATVDHYHITNSGSLVSCLADTVTFTAHDALHNAVEPGAGVQLTINTTTGRGSWTNQVGANLTTTAAANNGLALYQWQAGQSSLALPFNYTNPETDGVNVGFDVFDSAGVTSEIGGNLVVNTAGLYFYNQSAANTTWPTLVSGMDSLLFTGANLVVKAVRASDSNPAMCIPLFDEGQVLPLQLVFECENPQSCSASNVQLAVGNNGSITAVNTVDSNGTAGINPADNGQFSTVNLLFEDFGGNDIGARLSLVYPDAGIIQVHGRYDIPFNESADGTFGYSGDYLSGSGNAFVVRPFGYGVDFLGNFDGNPGDEYDRLVTAAANAGVITTAASWASDAAGSSFLKAGSNFAATVKAVSWQAADDLDNNGVPDSGAFLFDNNTTPNYGRELIPASRAVTLTHWLVAPVGGNQGVLTGGAFTSFADAGAQTNTLTWNEAGIIDLLASLDAPAGYLDSGQTITGAALNIGRFTPAYFEVSAPAIIPRPGFSSGNSAFTYMGEPFQVQFTVTARNQSGDITRNYQAGFAKLNDASVGAGQVAFYAIDDLDLLADANYTSRLVRDSSNPFAADFTSQWLNGNAGEVSLSGNLIFNRQASGAEEPPLVDLQIALTLQDSDGVVDSGRSVDVDDGLIEPGSSLLNLLGTREFRYGRLMLNNAFGSELIDYWDHDGDDDAASPEIPRDQDVAMAFYVEYYDGSGFVVNTDDSLTTFDIDNLLPVAGTWNLGLTGSGFDNLDAGEFIKVDTNANNGLSTLANGQTLESTATDMPFYFRAPGEGNDGSVIMEFDLDAAGLQFLQYDWRSAGQHEDEDADGDYGDNPRAVLEFGRYSGNDRIINWQELFIAE